MYELGNTWRMVNLLVGNDKQFNCTTRPWRAKMVGVVVTMYLLTFTVGLFAGSLYIKLNEENISTAEVEIIESQNSQLNQNQGFPIPNNF